MKSVTFFNNKGGVGKTTLLCNLAAYLVLEKNKKVLVVDADPQCNATSYSLEENVLEDIYSKSKRNTIEAFLHPVKRGKGHLNETFQPISSSRFGFDVIAGDPKLALSEDLLATDWNSATNGDARGLQTTFVFAHLLTMFQEEYDFIFFDVGPSLGAINRSVILASDFFIIPMSVDVFSLMALDNIKLSLTKWKNDIQRGLEAYASEEETEYEINGTVQKWKLQFLGYVMQQYQAKTVRGERMHVKAYEKISKQIPQKIDIELRKVFANPIATNFFSCLGEIENLFSLVPMSQTAKAPIFSLKARDGVVGAHFAKVSEAKNTYEHITENFLNNIEAIS